MLGSDNIPGTDVLRSTYDEQFENTLQAGDRNTIGLVGGNNMGSSIGSFDVSELLDGKELGWFVGAKSPTNFLNLYQGCSLLNMSTP